MFKKTILILSVLILNACEMEWEGPQVPVVEPVRREQTAHLEISTPGWPGHVSAPQAQLRVYFRQQMAASSGSVLLLEQGTNQHPVAQKWEEPGQVLVLYCSNLRHASAYLLQLDDFVCMTEGAPFSYRTSFCTTGSEFSGDLQWLTVLDQYPAPGASHVPPHLDAVHIRFNREVNVAGMEINFLDGGSGVWFHHEPRSGWTNYLRIVIDKSLLPQREHRLQIIGAYDREGLEMPVWDTRFTSGDGSAVDNPASHLVISEVCHGGFRDGGTRDEFIEIYNPGDEAVDLGAAEYRIYRSTASGSSYSLICNFSEAGHFDGDHLPATRVVPARGFYLIVNGQAAFPLNQMADALVKGSRCTLAEDNTLFLTRGGAPSQEQNRVDCVGWGAACLFEGSGTADNPPAGGSLERKACYLATRGSMEEPGPHTAAGNSEDSGDNRQDFIRRCIPQPQNSSSAPESFLP